jgi:steroid 5-alpha reductase family enzyme
LTSYQTLFNNWQKKNFELLKSDSNHPSLQLKKVGKLWSARIGLDYRALALKDGEDYIWVWIGTHDKYEQILKREG